MTPTTRGRSTPVTGVRVTTLIVAWLAVIYLAAPRVGLYYETLAVLYTVPPLALVYAYCLSHPRRATAPCGRGYGRRGVPHRVRRGDSKGQRGLTE